MTSTRRPCSASAAATLTAVVVLPTPPFWLATANTRAGRARPGLLPHVHHVHGGGRLAGDRRVEFGGVSRETGASAACAVLAVRRHRARREHRSLALVSRETAGSAVGRRSFHVKHRPRSCARPRPRVPRAGATTVVGSASRSAPQVERPRRRRSPGPDATASSVTSTSAVAALDGEQLSAGLHQGQAPAHQLRQPGYRPRGHERRRPHAAAESRVLGPTQHHADLPQPELGDEPAQGNPPGGPSARPARRPGPAGGRPTRPRQPGPGTDVDDARRRAAAAR